MLLFVSSPSIFITWKFLNSVARRMKVKLCHPVRWVVLNFDESVQFLSGPFRGVNFTQNKDVFKLAQMCEVEIDDLERRVVGYLRRSRHIRGIECDDAILTHPSVLGRALESVLVRRKRKGGAW